MWTRAELKQQGREGLKGYFWYGILAFIIVGVLGGIAGGAASGIGFLLKLIPFIGASIGTALTTMATGFVVLVLAMGMARFVILSQQQHQNAGIGEVFAGFRGENFQRVAEMQFAFSAIVGLWSSLFVIPGVMKTYQYFMVPYLIAEYPNEERKNLFKISRDIMEGKKMDTFLLDLSFIGWYLLGMIPCGLGVPVASLYHQATRTELYLRLKAEYLRGVDFQSTDGAGSGQMYSAPADTARIEMNTRVRKGILVGKQGGLTGANVPMNPGDVILIGSDARQCNLVINGAQVSPVHLRVMFNGTSFELTDHSEAGTYDLQKGRLPKGSTVTAQSGTYLQIGNGGDIFALEIK